MFELQRRSPCRTTLEHGYSTDDHKECKDAPAATLTWMGASAVTNYNDGMNCPVSMVFGVQNQIVAAFSTCTRLTG